MLLQGACTSNDLPGIERDLLTYDSFKAYHHLPVDIVYVSGLAFCVFYIATPVFSFKDCPWSMIV